MKGIILSVLSIVSIAVASAAPVQVRSDVLYFTTKGRAAAKALQSQYGFTQEVIVTDEDLPELIPASPQSLADPEFSEAAYKTRYAGRIEAVFIVDERGEVSEAAVKGCRNDLVASEIVAAVKSWKFNPARRGDTPARMLMKVPMTINLKAKR